MILIESLNHSKERWLWDHSKTHTIVQDVLLSVFNQWFVSKLNILTINSPVSFVGRLVSPSDVFFRGTFLGEVQVIPSECHLAWRDFIVRQVDTEHWFV